MVLKLLDKTIALAKLVGLEIDKQDIGITCTVAMSEGQVADLMAMIDYLSDTGMENGQVLSNVLHDLFGFKRAYLEPDSSHAKTFSPRSNDYASKVAS